MLEAEYVAFPGRRRWDLVQLVGVMSLPVVEDGGQEAVQIGNSVDRLCKGMTRGLYNSAANKESSRVKLGNPIWRRRVQLIVMV